ncbi:hypothetical protein F8388_026965 [Cannabis sativa]|uniref:Protein kinase domain-containing protein n=1 Tax=Cannabis sativa TaxID=3483 RepID=A0A7J6EDG8_CANSA|nr:hypothetical protein F8388_026965 [Cannabis sativa]
MRVSLSNMVSDLKLIHKTPVILPFSSSSPSSSSSSSCPFLLAENQELKPENVLLDSRGNLKLADFSSTEWLNEDGLVEWVVGTPYYVAPEVLLGREYNEIFQSVLRGNLRFPTRIFRSVSPSAKDLLRKMICKDSSRRLIVEQALSRSE